MDIRGLVEQMVQNQNFARVVNNPLSQFGTVRRPYLGTTLLPERLVPENAYVEEGIKYRTQMANDGTRYSPVQKKSGVLTGSFQVILGNSDIGSEFTGADYDALMRLIEQSTGREGVVGGGVDRQTMAAMSQAIQWADSTLNLPLLEKNEKQRWEAIVNAQVIRTGDNGYVETVNLANPTGHRINAGGSWSNSSYDPWPDIMAGVEFLSTLGYTVNRIITGTQVRSLLSNNTQIKLRNGILSVQANAGGGGTVTGLPGHVPLERLNEMLRMDGLPSLELYDLQYRTQSATGYFLPRGTMVLVATTGRDESIDLGDFDPSVASPELVADTIGYVGVGRAAGQSAPGRHVVVNAYENKPPRIEGEAWQTSFPVITEPEAIYIIKSIA